MIVFDLDGVLWHSSAIHAAAYRSVFEEAGIAMPDYAMIAGRRTDEVIEELLSSQRQRGRDPYAKTIAELIEAKQARARQLLRDQPPVAPECAAVVGKLARHKTLALASSASATTVELFLDLSKTRPLFSAVVSGDDVSVAKPDPAIYTEALRRLGCEPSKAAIIEDAPSGIRAALAAGVSFVIGIEGTTTPDVLLRAGARKVIRNLQDLVAP